MKTCLGKLMKQFESPPFLRELPLSTNTPISEKFFNDPPLNFKNENPPSPLILRGRRGEETMNVLK